MKKIIFAFAVLATSFASAQVGVGNTSPKATFDVTGVTTATVADGVLVPRFTASVLATKDAAYGADQNGALVFITDPAGATGKASEATAVGFYYYNNTAAKWKAVGGASAAPLLNVTVPTTNDYTILETDAIIYRNLTATGTLTIPASLPAGKVFYIANTSGFFDWNYSPMPINTGMGSVAAGQGGTIVTLGGGQFMFTSGY
jgi:hypothetical protein